MEGENRNKTALFLVSILISVVALPFASGSSESEFYLGFKPMPLEDATNEITGFEFLPNSNEFFTINQHGEVMHYEIIGDDIDYLGSFDLPDVEFGLQCAVSIAFDVNYDENGLIFFSYCPNMYEMVVSRYHFDGSDYDSVPTTQSEIFRAGDFRAVRPWHSIGTLNMDSAGNLWIPVGDKHVDDNAQNMSNPLGSIIRIIPNRDLSGSGHEPTPGNPFIGVEGVDEDIYAYGIRSPWTATLDSQERLWVGDVGWLSYEEINLITEPGQNFGWALAEGPCLSNCTGLTDPIHAYPHDFGASSIWVGREYLPIGPDRYDGHLYGKMLYGDFYGDFIHMVELDENNEIILDQKIGEHERITAWGQGTDGYLYVTVFDEDSTVLYRVMTASPISSSVIITLIAVAVFAVLMLAQVQRSVKPSEK